MESNPTESTPTQAGYDVTHSDPLGLIPVGRAVLRHIRPLVLIPLVAGVLAVVVALLLSPQYTARTSFLAEEDVAGSLPANLAGLASQFGVSLGSGSSTSPDFYRDLLERHVILDSLLLRPYADPDTGGAAPLMDWMEVDPGKPFARRMEIGYAALLKQIEVDVDLGTGLVDVDVTTGYPWLSAEVANDLVTMLDHFNLEIRQSNARERRVFIEERLQDAEDQLRAAEDALKTFLEQNMIRRVPSLQFEEDRLRRHVDVARELYLTLRREYETARIEEVNTTPLITLVDVATPPTRKSAPRRRQIVLLAVVLGAMIAAGVVVSRVYMERLEQDAGADYEALRRDARAAMNTMRPRRLPGRSTDA